MMQLFALLRVAAPNQADMHMCIYYTVFTICYKEEVTQRQPAVKAAVLMLLPTFMSKHGFMDADCIMGWFSG